MKILDCTLRDGGYYTNWDFSRPLVDAYLQAVNALPIDAIEVGYRSMPQSSYFGEYFYCPQYVLDHITAKCTKKVAIMFNEKDVRPEMLDTLLSGCEKVDIVRMAIDPANFSRAVVLGKAIKERGFEVAFNVMYMSNWEDYPDLMTQLETIEGVADYLNLVDSFGGVYPEDVKRIYNSVATRTNVPIGFHGHNNLELGLINSLTALEEGATIIDATFTGMGRGAGNLKMELLLTALNSKYDLPVDFNELGNVVAIFEDLKEKYGWGTNLPYMIAGANSFPQKEVMNWVTNRFYSFNSIIRALQNKKEGRKDNHQLKVLSVKDKVKTAVIIGGGPSAKEHAEGVLNFLNQNDNVVVIHASSKKAKPYFEIQNTQYFCLVGSEGHRLENNLPELHKFRGTCILPPWPRKMGTYIPDSLVDSAVELENISFTDTLLDTHTAIALQAAIDLGAKQVFLVGYDGYPASESKLERELAKENQQLFNAAAKHFDSFQSFFPTEYDVEVNAIYAHI